MDWALKHKNFGWFPPSIQQLRWFLTFSHFFSNTCEYQTSSARYEHQMKLRMSLRLRVQLHRRASERLLCVPGNWQYKRVYSSNSSWLIRDYSERNSMFVEGKLCTSISLRVFKISASFFKEGFQFPSGLLPETHLRDHQKNSRKVYGSWPIRAFSIDTSKVCISGTPSERWPVWFY